MRAVVVGGGIVGLASAHALAERDVEVVLCEKGSLGNGSTARALGGIRTQFSTPVNVDLTLQSLPVWESFEEAFGVDIAFRQAGYLFLGRTEETADLLEAQVEMQRERGAETELLSAAEASEVCSGVRTEAVTAATYNPRDGFADPYLAVQGYAGAVREAGVDVRTKTEVRDVVLREGRVVGVEVSGPETDGTERIEADVVVNAAGPWARRVATMAGLDIPVAPRRRQALVVEPETTVPETDPLTIDLETGSHFRPERDGNAIVGGYFAADDPDAEPDRFHESYDLDWATTALERTEVYCSYFGEDTRIRRGWAGLYAVTPDHHPILETSLPGFVQAVGFSGHGFQHAPAVGEVVADLVVDGESSTVDVSVLRSDRFERGDLIHERNVA
jgi:sarcosine oxidase subunit beta